MVKSNKQLMEDFKKLEEALANVLKIKEGGIVSELGDNPTKAQLETYVKKVNRAKKIFAKYEEYSNEISKRLKQKQVNLNNQVNKAEEKFTEEKDKYVDEVIVDRNQTKVVKKKKKVTERTY